MEERVYYHDKYYIFIAAYLVTTSLFQQKMPEVVADLAGCHKIHISDTFEEKNLKSCLTETIRGVKIILNIPEDFRKKMEFDLPVMKKKKDKLVKELEKMNKMVSSKTYKEKATLDAQKEHSYKVK